MKKFIVLALVLLMLGPIVGCLWLPGRGGGHGGGDGHGGHGNGHGGGKNHGGHGDHGGGKGHHIEERY